MKSTKPSTPLGSGHHHIGAVAAERRTRTASLRFWAQAVVHRFWQRMKNAGGKIDSKLRAVHRGAASHRVYTGWRGITGSLVIASNFFHFHMLVFPPDARCLVARDGVGNSLGSMAGQKLRFQVAETNGWGRGSDLS